MSEKEPPAPAGAPLFQPDICAPEHRRFLLIAAVLASALGFIDGTVVAIALPSIRASLSADLWQAQWFHNAYMLCLSALILVGGALGDRFGVVRVFAIGIGFFILASMICAIAPSANFMIAARALQGVGAAIMVPGSLAVISKAYPAAERGRAIGIWAAASSMTTAMGPIIGGLALSFGGPEMWRWIFAINLPLGGLAMVLLMTTARGGRPHSKTRIDVIGAALATLAFGGIAWGLTSHQFVFLWAGAATLGVFLWSQHHMKTPMMPLGLYRRKTFAITNLMTFSLWGALNLMFFFMPMTFIAGWGFKEIDASAVFAPMSIFMALISTRAGRLADRIGAPPLMVTGALIVGAGYGIMGLLAPFQNRWGHMLPAMCLVGGGMALVVAPMTSAMMGAVPAEQSGIASGINNAVSRMAGLMFVAAMGGVASALYIGAGGPDSFGMLSDTPGHGTAMTRAFQGIAYISCGLCLGSAALAGLLLGARQPAARPGT